MERPPELGGATQLEFDIGRATALREFLKRGPMEALKDKAMGFKTEATKHFKDAKFAIALKGYLTALWLLGDAEFPGLLGTSNPAYPRGPQMRDVITSDSDDEFAIQLLLNASLCSTKLRDDEGALALATEAHRRGPSAKSALRIAKAKEGLGDVKGALTMLAAYPSNPICRREIDLVKQRRDKEKHQAAKMFSQQFYSEDEQRQRRATARADAQKHKQRETIVVDLSKESSEKDQKDKLDTIAKIQQKHDQHLAALQRIAPADAEELMRRQAKGFAKSDLTAYYAAARDKEARRVGDLMTDDEKLDFATFCSTPGISEAEIDTAFDLIRAKVDARTTPIAAASSSLVLPQTFSVEPPPPAESPPTAVGHYSEEVVVVAKHIPDDDHDDDDVPVPESPADDSVTEQQRPSGDDIPPGPPASWSHRLGRWVYLYVFYPFVASSTRGETK